MAEQPKCETCKLPLETVGLGFETTVKPHPWCESWRSMVKHGLKYEDMTCDVCRKKMETFALFFGNEWVKRVCPECIVDAFFFKGRRGFGG